MLATEPTPGSYRDLTAKAKADAAAAERCKTHADDCRCVDCYWMNKGLYWRTNMAVRLKLPKADDGGEQLDLIECDPENGKQIKRLARAYKKAQGQRTVALREEIKQKEKLLAAAKETGIKQNADGDIKFRCDGMVITIRPRDELVRVKFNDPDADDSDGDEE